jgi:hypothetical protein
MMQLSKSDLHLLSNFASINQSIMFQEGKKQGTSANSQSMFAYAEFDAEFPTDFPLFDLNHFLQVYDLVASTGDVELEFPEDQNILIVKSAVTEQGLRSAPIEVIRTPPKNFSPKEKPVVSFTLKEDMLSYGKKSAAINQFPNLIFESDGDNIYMTAENTDNPSSEQHRRKIQEDVHGCFEFRVVFSVSRLKMISDDYRVDIFEPNLGRFTSENRDYTFFSALDSNVVYDNGQFTDDIDEEDDE